jgi:hypothetical protein
MWHTSVATVHRHDAGAAEAEVVLQRDLRALDLTGLGLAAQVPDELGALREAGEAELVDRALAAGRVAEHVAGVRLLDRRGRTRELCSNPAAQFRHGEPRVARECAPGAAAA